MCELKFSGQSFSRSPCGQKERKTELDSVLTVVRLVHVPGECGLCGLSESFLPHLEELNRLPSAPDRGTTGTAAALRTAAEVVQPQLPVVSPQLRAAVAAVRSSAASLPRLLAQDVSRSKEPAVRDVLPSCCSCFVLATELVVLVVPQRKHVIPMTKLHVCLQKLKMFMHKNVCFVASPAEF